MRSNMAMISRRGWWMEMMMVVEAARDFCGSGCCDSDSGEVAMMAIPTTTQQPHVRHGDNTQRGHTNILTIFTAVDESRPVVGSSCCCWWRQWT